MRLCIAIPWTRVVRIGKYHVAKVCKRLFAEIIRCFEDPLSLARVRRGASTDITTIVTESDGSALVKENLNGKRILRRLDAYKMIFVRLILCVFGRCNSKHAMLLLICQPNIVTVQAEAG